MLSNTFMNLVECGLALGTVTVLVRLALVQRHSGADVARATRSGVALSLLRCLFPAWRFYEGVGPAPMLTYRVQEGSTVDAFGPWQPALDSTAARVPLPFNALGNLQHALQSLVERFEDDLAQTDAASELVSYQLVNAWIAGRVNARAYQFRLQLTDANESVLFVSEVQQPEHSP
ncbi:MAG: hypothetical protein RL701_7081 [Pseudomonadota bacterium]|jgi:hypothetical protein